MLNRLATRQGAARTRLCTAAILALSVSIACVLPSFATSPEWQNFTNGSNIAGLAQDASSIWVATNGGLVRIDRATGQSSFFNRANSGLTSNVLTAVHVTPDGTVWVGMASRGQNTGWGLAKFDGTIWTVYDKSNSGVSASPRAISSDSAGRLWIATDKGLVEFDGTIWTTHKPSDHGMISNFVRDVLVDVQGNVWFGVIPKNVLNEYEGGGLAKYDGNTWTIFTSDNSGLPSNWVRSLAQDAAGAIWIGSQTYFKYYAHETYVGGLTRFDGSTWTTYDSANSGLPGDTVSSIAIDAGGAKWLGTGGGLASFDGTSWTIYDTSNSGVPSNSVYHVLIDSNGRRWVGTYSAGLARFDGTSWTLFETSNSGLPFSGTQSQQMINSLTEDRGGNKWIGLQDGGIAELVHGNWLVYNSSNAPLQYNTVDGIALDQNDNLWIAALDGGLVHFDRTNWTSYTHDNSGLPSSGVTQVAVDPSGTVWMGSFAPDGVTRFDGSNWVIYTPQNTPGLLGGGRNALVIDHAGRVWSGGNGASRFDGTTWSAMLPADKRVECLEVDAAGNVWAGTIFDGAGRFDGSSWTFYDTSNSGLQSNYVRSIETDAGGNVWFGSCGGGLTRFDGTNWQTFNASNSGIADDYCIHALLEDRLGNLWIGEQSSGVSVYKPGGIATDVARNIRPEAPPGLAFLAQNQPNPFNPVTVIAYDIASPGAVSLAIYDTAGRPVRRIVSGHQVAGHYTATWDGRGPSGASMASGVYVYRLIWNGHSRARRMVLLK